GADPALRAVVVDLGAERRRGAGEPRVLRLHEVLAEVVLLVGGEVVVAQVALERRLVGRQECELGLLAAGEAEQLEERARSRVGGAEPGRVLVDAGVVAKAVARLRRVAPVEAEARADRARGRERAARAAPRSKAALPLEPRPRA